jgi:hypothetical protein
MTPQREKTNGWSRIAKLFLGIQSGAAISAGVSLRKLSNSSLLCRAGACGASTTVLRRFSTSRSPHIQGVRTRQPSASHSVERSALPSYNDGGPLGIWIDFD